jgi:hypothetical protein
MMIGIIEMDQTWRSPDGLHYSEEEIAVPGTSSCMLIRIVRWS